MGLLHLHQQIPQLLQRGHGGREIQQRSIQRRAHSHQHIEPARQFLQTVHLAHKQACLCGNISGLLLDYSKLRRQLTHLLFRFCRQPRGQFMIHQPRHRFLELLNLLIYLLNVPLHGVKHRHHRRCEHE